MLQKKYVLFPPDKFAPGLLRRPSASASGFPAIFIMIYKLCHKPKNGRNKL